MHHGSQNFHSLLQALFPPLRSRTSWNERFEYWERPASETEEIQIARSAGMIQRALNNNAWLVGEGVQIRSQGSYHNNTNVRQDSDMDLCVWHPGIEVMIEAGLTYEEVNLSLDYTYNNKRLIHNVAAELRCKVGQALRATFGTANVDEGNKPFRVSAVPGSRADADVVPAIRLDYVRRRWTGLVPSLDCVEGVVIYAKDGTRIENFPRHHHENGKAKRERTGYRFKRMVRTAKRLRDELLALGQLSPTQAPSFLIESLIYGVEDFVFLRPGPHFDRTTWHSFGGLLPILKPW